MPKQIFFFLGTEAELIKIFPVIIEAKKRNLNYKIIASGQNNIVDSMIFRKTDCGPIDLELSKEEDIKKTAVGLFQWWLKTYSRATGLIKKAFPMTDFKNSQMVVHGDTVSTFMGAQIGRKLGMQVCHVEAGLRSHNLFSPFPEEIDRLLTSRRAYLHFAPGNIPAENLKGVSGKVINTYQNTLLDSLKYSQKFSVENGEVLNLINDDYFVFVMHRQENLVSKAFVSDVVNAVIDATKNRKCVIILHEITKNAFIKFGLMEELKKNNNVIMLPRVDYFDFMKLLNNSAYVITDGGSNQEELFYMGKPCLIMRTTTERNEGLGVNARLFDGTASDVGRFVKDVESTKVSYDMPEGEPSEIILDSLLSN